MAMTMQTIAMLAGSISLTSAAQIVLKIGSDRSSAAFAGNGMVSAIAGVVTSPLLMLGLALYGIAAIVWIIVLSRVDLSYAYPLAGLGFIQTVLLSYLFLGETISTERLFGTLLIAAGCFLVGSTAR